MYLGSEKCKLFFRNRYMKRLLGRPRYKWEDNIKIDHTEIGWKEVDWVEMNQGSVQWHIFVNVVMDEDAHYLGCCAMLIHK